MSAASRKIHNRTQIISISWNPQLLIPKWVKSKGKKCKKIIKKRLIINIMNIVVRMDDIICPDTAVLIDLTTLINSNRRRLEHRSFILFNFEIIYIYVYTGW